MLLFSAYSLPLHVSLRLMIQMSRVVYSQQDHQRYPTIYTLRATVSKICCFQLWASSSAKQQYLHSFIHCKVLDLMLALIWLLPWPWARSIGHGGVYDDSLLRSPSLPLTCCHTATIPLASARSRCHAMKIENIISGNIFLRCKPNCDCNPYCVLCIVDYSDCHQILITGLGHVIIYANYWPQLNSSFFPNSQRGTNKYCDTCSAYC